MIATGTESHRRFYRDRDKAILGGVCAGLAAYLGFNLKVTRCLAFIAFLMMMPIAVIAYLAAVFLIPSESHREASAGKRDAKERKPCSRRRSKRDRTMAKEQQKSLAAEINKRCLTLDERLKRLEKHVTSKRYQLDQELSRL
jgi:phage shock protein C